jgi:hypothetical protein
MVTDSIMNLDVTYLSWYYYSLYALFVSHTIYMWFICDLPTVTLLRFVGNICHKQFTILKSQLLSIGIQNLSERG